MKKINSKLRAKGSIPAPVVQDLLNSNNANGNNTNAVVRSSIDNKIINSGILPIQKNIATKKSETGMGMGRRSNSVSSLLPATKLYQNV